MKQHRTEVIKVIRQQMEAETDPQKKVEYAKQLAKLLPRPRQARRPRKAEATPPSNRKKSIIDTHYGCALDDCPDGKKVQAVLVIEFEKRQRAAGRKFTEEERTACLEELFAGLSPRDRQAAEAYDANETA